MMIALEQYLDSEIGQGVAEGPGQGAVVRPELVHIFITEAKDRTLRCMAGMVQRCPSFSVT